MTDDKPIVLTLTLREGNGVLMALARFPYAEVVELIGKVQTQAKEQAQGDPK